MTLLCVLLRERLDQFEASAPESDRLLLTLEDLRDMQRPFFRERTDERTLQKKLDETVNKVAELGFLRRLSGSEARYEVRRIIKARIDSERLAEIRVKLLAASGAEEAGDA